MRKKHRPNVYFLCMHKAASTFVADVLFPSIARRSDRYDLFNFGSEFIRFKRELATSSSLEAVDAEFEATFASFCRERPIPASNTLVGRLYPRHVPAIEAMMSAAFADAPCAPFVLRRDPRDALVSYYYSLAYSHSPTGIESSRSWFDTLRADLLALDVTSGCKLLCERQPRVFSEFLYCARLVRGSPRVRDLPYEQLVANPGEWLDRFVAASALDDLVDAAWREEMAKHLEPPQAIDPRAHRRRVRPGNWREVFDEELRAEFERRVGKEMATLGYEW